MTKHNRPSTKTGKVWNTGKPPVIFHAEVRDAVDRLERQRQVSSWSSIYKTYYYHWTARLYDKAQTRFNKQYPDQPHRTAAVREWRRTVGIEK